MSPSWRQRLFRIGLVLGSLLFIHQIWIGYQVVREDAIRVSSIPMLGAACVLIGATIGLQMIGWSWLMRGLGVRLPWRAVIGGYGISFLPRYIPGNIWGYLSRGEWYRQNHDVPYAVSNSGSILEVVGVVASICMWIGIRYASQVQGVVQLVLFGCAFLIPFLIGSVLERFPRQDNIHVQGRFGLRISMQIGSRLWLKVTVVYLLLWLCYGAAINLLIEATGTSYLNGLLDATFIFGLAWLSGFLVLFVPSGLGVREVTLSGLLTLFAGVPVAHASAISVMSRVCATFAELIWVILGLALFSSRKKSPDC